MFVYVGVFICVFFLFMIFIFSLFVFIDFFNLLVNFGMIIFIFMLVWVFWYVGKVGKNLFIVRFFSLLE